MRRRWPALVLLVLGAILVPLSAVAIWTKREVVDTDRYVATMAPLAHNEAVQEGVANALTLAFTSNVDVVRQTRQALPPRAQFLAPPIAKGVGDFVHGRALAIAQSNAFAQLWSGVNRRAHARAVKLLTGEGGDTVKVQNDALVLDLGAVADRVNQQLDARGVNVFDNSSAQAGDKTIVLFQSSALATARGAVRALEKLAVVLPILMLAALIGGALLFPDRRRGTLWAGAALAAGAVLLLVALVIVRSIYIGAVPIKHDVAAAVYDTVLRFLRDGLRVVALIGLLVALGAALAGPSQAAIRVRSFARGGISRARTGLEGRGMALDRVGGFTAAHETLLRSSLLALACIALLAAGQATIGLVIALALVVAAGLGLIELFSRAAGPPVKPGAP
jgi:hypothetical protein